MDPADGFAYLAHRIIGILDMHADSRVRDHAARGAIVSIKRRVAQGDVEIETIVKHGLLHGAPPGGRNVTGTISAVKPTPTGSDAGEGAGQITSGDAQCPSKIGKGSCRERGCR